MEYGAEEKLVFYLRQSIKAETGGMGIDKINEFSLHQSLSSSAQTRNFVCLRDLRSEESEDCL